jgi:hypothetical protein
MSIIAVRCKIDINMLLLRPSIAANRQAVYRKDIHPLLIHPLRKLLIAMAVALPSSCPLQPRRQSIHPLCKLSIPKLSIMPVVHLLLLSIAVALLSRR